MGRDIVHPPTIVGPCITAIADLAGARCDTLRTHGSGEEIPLQERAGLAHRWLVQQFVVWLDGGPAMTTNVVDNLH